MLRFASLASGSGGNALVVECGATRVMLDCGLGVRQTETRLAQLGLQPGDIQAIVVTHEHQDHVGGVLAFAQRHGTKVYATWGTQRAAALDAAALAIELIDSHVEFSISNLQIVPMPVPHDAREPVQFVFSDGQRRLGVLTDTGAPTAHISACLSGVDALVLECNHDLDMLEQGGYPEWLKRRVGGPLGHLSNRQAAQLLASIDHSRLQHLVAAHLSASNNSPTLAQSALAGVIGCQPGWIGVADQKTGLAWREVR